MSWPTFNPSPAPSPGTSIGQELALNVSELGDGYTQASPKGLNHIRRKLTLRWDVLTLEQAQALDAFFAERGGHLPFRYTVRGEGQPRAWVCSDWNLTDGAPASFTATLREYFGTV